MVKSQYINHLGTPLVIFRHAVITYFSASQMSPKRSLSRQFVNGAFDFDCYFSLTDFYSFRFSSSWSYYTE